ncbi:hypothetical protein ACFWC5_12045 [Streptomyces sp. NPDC060085]|uniref:hypothetical protein n=1 Tax=Streptomyces sp. NPDC060085 TaxID=3347054 RepID=UPI0036585F39
MGSRRGPIWEFTYIAEFHGRFEDVAALAPDDIWAVGSGNNGRADTRLLHYDGEHWEQRPFPEVLGNGAYAPRFEEVGEGELWLRPYADGTAVDKRWAKWDGNRWSAVQSPTPGSAGALVSEGPDDIWALAGGQTAEHWDGTRWTTTRLPYGANDLAVVGPDDVWAVGSRSTGPGTELGHGERYSQPASMHWDGKSWTAVDTPQVRFEEPIPPEPNAGLTTVVALHDGEVRSYGGNTFEHGEIVGEPADEVIEWSWDGSQWVDRAPAPGGCQGRLPVAEDDGGLFLDGNWYLTDTGRCEKIGRHRLPTATGAGTSSNQSLWLQEIHRIPGTDEWIGAGAVQVNQTGNPFDAPVVVRLKRGAV